MSLSVIKGKVKAPHRSRLLADHRHTLVRLGSRTLIAPVEQGSGSGAWWVKAAMKNYNGFQFRVEDRGAIGAP